MALFTNSFLAVLALLAGDSPAQPASLQPLPAVAEFDATPTCGIAPVAYQAPVLPDSYSMETAQPLPELVHQQGLSLEALEQLALGNNPVVGQAAAKVRALRGKCLQVGLKPNPTVGYMADEIFNEGTAGFQGGYVGQQYVTAGKLEKNRAVVAAEIQRAEQELMAVQRRVRTDIRMAYYRALVAQRRVSLATDLVDLAGQAVAASTDLLGAQEIPRAALLQTEVEEQNAMIALRTAQSELDAAWQQIAAVTGQQSFPPQPLTGDPTVLPTDLDWQTTLNTLTTASPEIAAAVAELSRSRRALNRACVEAVPNVSTQAIVQYDDGSDDTIAGVQVGIPLPIWDRNQGGIRQAQAEVTVASQNIDRVALDLQQRLALEFQRYSAARAQAEIYTTEILPKADQTFDLVRRGYAAGEVGYLELLTAQRTYAQTNLLYLDALDSLWASWTRIDGFLLDNSLTVAP